MESHHLSPEIFKKDTDVAEEQTHVHEVGRTLITLNHVFSSAELVNAFVSELAGDICDAMPDNPCVGASLAIACFPNPGYYICKVVEIVTESIAAAILQAAFLALEIVEGQYLNVLQMSDTQVYYDYYYSRATYVNGIGHAEWNAKALEAIRVNMKDQHMQMKFQLQERHKDIANHVGQDVSENCIHIC